MANIMHTQTQFQALNARSGSTNLTLQTIIERFYTGAYGEGPAAERHLCSLLLAFETRAASYMRQRARSSTLIGLAT